MRHRDWLPALLTAFWATCTFACTVPQDLRPYSQRLADAPLAFIGTVTSVSGLRVTFAVHHAINGAPGPSTVVETLTPSTCSIAFAVGQRWLFAGPATSHPSVLLIANARTTPATDFGRLRRADDTRAQFPAAWQACTAGHEGALSPTDASTSTLASEVMSASRLEAGLVVRGSPPPVSESVENATMPHAAVAPTEQARTRTAARTLR